LLMSEYNVSLADIQHWTKEQMFLLKDKMERRLKDKQKFEASLHGAKMEAEGLDTDGAIPIEVLIDKGIGFM